MKSTYKFRMNWLGVVAIILSVLVVLGFIAAALNEGGQDSKHTVAMKIETEPTTIPTGIAKSTVVVAPQIDMAAFVDRTMAVITDQEDIMTDLATEATDASQESSLAGMQAHGPAFRTLQDRWLATGDSMDELRPEPPEMQEFFTLWVQAYSQGAQALDSIAEGAETLDITLVSDATDHLNRATELFGEAADALPTTSD